MFPPNVEPTYTPNLHLELFSPLGVGWREDATAGALLDENMLLIDAAVASGGAVTSVNGKAGVVVLSYSDVGADASGAAAAAQSNAEANAATLYIPLSVLTAHGDIIYEDASLGPIRLPIGSTGYLMTVAGGQPAWEAVPTWNQSTTGTAAGLSGTPALPNGTTAVTQSPLNATTKVATTAYADAAVAAAPQLIQTGLLAQYNMTDAGGSDGMTLTDSSSNANNGTLGDRAPITSLSLTTNVITITAANDYTIGQVVTLNNLTTNPSLNGTSLTVLAGGLSSSQFTANLTHANIASAAETGFAVVTATLPTWIANTGGLKFVASSKQLASLPSAVNGAKTMMLVTFFDPAAATNEYGSPISPNSGNSGPNIMYTYAQSTASLGGSQNYRAETWNGVQHANSTPVHGYVILTLTTAAGGDTIYLYNVTSATGSTIGQLGSGNYQLGGGHGAGADTEFDGQIVFAAFWSGTLTAAQVTQNVQAVQQLLLQRGLVLNGTPGGGTWQNPNYTDTFCLDGDSETSYLVTANVPTVTGSPNIFNSSQSGQTAETISSAAPYWVDVNLPNLGAAVNGGTVGRGANRAGVIAFIGTNDSGAAASIPLGSLAKYCRDRHKAGWNKVACTTMMSRAGADGFKNNYNALIRQNWMNWADMLLDIGAVPVLGADGAQANTAYLSGGLHWGTTLGQQLAGWLYSYAMRRMYGNTVNGAPNTASSTVYVAQPEDIYLYVDTTSNNVDVYLPPAQFFTGQTVTIKAKAGASNTLTLHPKPVVSSTISATSLTSTTLTVTVANNFAAGDVVVFSGLNTNTTKNGFSGIIATASATQFTMTVTAASWSGSDTAGTATLANMCQIGAITNLSLTTNVATITASNNFSVGDTVVLSGLTTTPGLNGTSAVVSGTGLSSSGFQIPITHANIGSGAETGIALKTYAAETIDGSSTLTQSNGKTVVLLSQLSASSTGLANWITLQNSVVGTNVVLQTSAYAAKAGDFVKCDTSGGGFTVTLPLSANNTGQPIIVKKISTDYNILTIATSGSDMIDLDLTKNITVPQTALGMLADGVTTWEIN